MKQKLYYLLALTFLLLVGGGTNVVHAADVTVKRSIDYVAAGGTTDAVHQFTGYNDGANDIITVTADETAGSLIGTPSKTRNVTYNGKETKYSAAKVYRNKNASSGDVNNDSYDDNCYVGIKLVIADGYRIDVSQLKAQVGVSDDNFKYKIIVTDGTHNLYESQDKTAKKANANISTVTISSPKKLVVAGTVYLRMYFTITNGGTSKYIQPFELSLTGDVATATQYTINTNMLPDNVGTVSGSGSYYENQDVFLSATPNAGYSFVKWTTGGNDVSSDASYSFKAGAADATYTANFISSSTYTITGAIADGQSSYGSITNAGTNNVNQGDNITLVATPNEGYLFVNWTKDGEAYSTDASITVTPTADATYVANFKKLYKVSYNLESYAGTITGKVLCNYNSDYDVNEIYADVDDKFTIPAYAHRYLYREGYTFAGWSDGNNTYQSGDVINGLTSDITLTPTWTATTQSLADSNAETVVTWSFAKSNLVFVDWQSNDEYGYNTETATVNQEKIAVPMKIMKGKVANYKRSDAIAQTNQNTTFTIPAVKGMTVKIADAYKEFSATTIAGSTDYTGTGSKTIEYTYTGTDETIDIVIGESGQYLKTVVVTYPLVEKRAASDLTITAPANGAWSVDLDDQSAAKTQQIVYSSSSDGAITYTSSNTTIATVSANGLITAKSNGTATITVSQAATDAYQAGEATINVTVTGGVTILGTDEVSLVYTTSGYDSNTKTWTNGTYTLVSSNSISGNDGQCFKLQNYTYTLKVPSNIRVDKIEYTGYDYNGSNSVTEGETSTATITVDGTTALTGWKAYYANYGSAVNTTVAQEISHNTGEDITLAVTGAGQILGTLKLYVSEIKPTTAPTLVSQSNTTKRNGTVVLTFSQPMASATATIDGQSVTAEGGTSTLTFCYWGLDYGKQVTFTLPANAIKDAYDNNYEGEDITVNFTIDAKQALTKKKFDVIVGTEGNEDLQTVLNAYKDYSGSERKYIFIPDGTYKLTGNSSFTTTSTQKGYVYDETTETVGSETQYEAGTYTDNAMTQLRSSNLSIIGQSKDKTILYNIPYIPGISYTSTLEFRSGSDNYLQDLTLKNMYAGGANDKGVAVAFYDRGTRTIAKNISCWSNQDTYVSNGARDYYETSTFAGTVDFICGNGDVWFQQCDLIINNRSGNVITAPRTAATEKWGYVFYENTISRAEGATLVTDKSWYLGRPWNESPAATFLYTTMNTVPTDAGWTNMTNGKVLRFHEYGSKNANGTLLNLNNRSISACNGADTSDDPVLSEEQAAQYTLHNVLGGTDGWDPSEYTAQVSVTGLALNDYTLTWDDNEDALCWMVFKDGVYFDNVITNSITADGAGEYTVRAANARGGLGEGMTVTVSTEAITTNTHGNASHVASKALDFSGVEGLKAYIATAADAEGITLAEVTEVPAGTAFVVQATEKAENTYYVPTTTEDVTLTAANVFQGSNSATATAGNATYALSKSKGMFAKVKSGVTIPTGVAYVNITNGAKETLAFFFGETTGIAEVEAAEAQQGGVRKQLINGRLVIIKGDKRYNAAGAEF